MHAGVQAEAHERQFEATRAAHSGLPCLLWAADIPSFEETIEALRARAQCNGGSVERESARGRADHRPRVLRSDPEFENALSP